MSTNQAHNPEPAHSISAGDQVIAVDLTADKRDSALVVDFTGTRLVLQAATAFGVGDAVQVEHHQGLLLGEVVAEETQNAHWRVVVRCYQWLGKRQIKSIRRKTL